MLGIIQNIKWTLTGINRSLVIIFFLIFIPAFIFYQSCFSGEVILRIDEARITKQFNKGKENAYLELEVREVGKDSVIGIDSKTGIKTEHYNILLQIDKPYELLEKIKPYPITESPFGFIWIKKSDLTTKKRIIEDFSLDRFYLKRLVTKDDKIEVFLTGKSYINASLRIVSPDGDVCRIDRTEYTIKAVNEKIKNILNSGKNGVIIYSNYADHNKYSDEPTVIVREAGILDQPEKMDKIEGK